MHNEKNGRILLWFISRKAVRACQNALKGKKFTNTQKPLQTEIGMDLGKCDFLWRKKTNWVKLCDLHPTITTEKVSSIINNSVDFINLEDKQVYLQKCSGDPTQRINALIECPDHEDARDLVQALRGEMDEKYVIWAQLTNHPMGRSKYVQISNLPVNKRYGVDRQLWELIQEKTKVKGVKRMVLTAKDNRNKKMWGLAIVECHNDEDAKAIVMALNGVEMEIEYKGGNETTQLCTRCMTVGQWLQFCEANNSKLPFTQVHKTRLFMKAQKNKWNQYHKAAKTAKFSIMGNRMKKRRAGWVAPKFRKTMRRIKANKRRAKSRNTFQN